MFLLFFTNSVIQTSKMTKRQAAVAPFSHVTRLTQLQLWQTCGIIKNSMFVKWGCEVVTFFSPQKSVCQQKAAAHPLPSPSPAVPRVIYVHAYQVFEPFKENKEFGKLLLFEASGDVTVRSGASPVLLCFPLLINPSVPPCDCDAADGGAVLILSLKMF